MHGVHPAPRLLGWSGHERFSRVQNPDGAFPPPPLLSAPICDFVENLNHALADFPVLRLAAAAGSDAADNLAACREREPARHENYARVGGIYAEKLAALAAHFASSPVESRATAAV